MKLLVLLMLLFTTVRSESSPEIRLEQDVRKLSVDFSPRSHKDLENLNAAANYIHESFTKAGARVEEQAFEVDGKTYRNIIAHFGEGEEPLRIVGAHYDAAEGTPGADDNASGVAGLLELARKLGEQAKLPAIQLVAYTLEEPPYFGGPFMGSFVHAKSLSDQKTKIEWMISLEMIGYFTDKRKSQTYPLPGMEKQYPSKGNFIAVISKLDQTALTQKIHKQMQEGTDLPVEFFNGPERLPGVDFSDHRNYWAFGFPAVMVTNTAFMRNQEYHADGDTADRLDYKRMAKVVDGVFMVLTHTL